MPDVSQIVINPKEYLVTRLKDYFAVPEGEFSTRILETMPVHVGIIEKVGEDLPQDREGKIIYYKTDLSDKIEIKGIGKYELVADAYKYLVRMDQDKNNH